MFNNETGFGSASGLTGLISDGLLLSRTSVADVYVDGADMFRVLEIRAFKV